MRTSIATVCLSGTLTEKLHACADAGFDGVELFEPDLLASPASPEEIGALARRLGLTLDLYQPFRDAEGVTETEFEAVLHRARAKFRLMQRLGVDTVLVCSNVATATVDDDAVSADQLRRLGDEAQAHGVRIAYEALAWGRYVDDYRRAWRIAERADHPAVGVCLDSFHILSRGHDPAAIEQIPAEKIFFLQLADAPALTMDVLSWSRHHRLFPGEGSFDLAAFLGHVLDAGYTGPVSLEVFNDTFRQTDVERTARQAKRSLTWLEDQVARRSVRSRRTDGPSRLPDVGQPVAFDFVEVKAEDAGEVDELLRLLGFSFRGHHRSKPVRLWTQGTARVLCNEHLARDRAPTLAAIGMEVPDPAASVRRAGLLGAPSVFRRTRAGEQDLVAFRAPEGTEIFFADPSPGEPAWVPEFDGGEQPGGAPGLAIDHVNLAHPWQTFEESVLFHTSVLALRSQGTQEVAAPTGLVRSRVMRSDDGAVRLALNVAPVLDRGLPQHVAFRSPDVVAAARLARTRGLHPLPIPANYYDDLAARFDLPAAVLDEMRELGVLYDRDESGGEFRHFYTRTVGAVFFELVQRDGGYDGYGAAGAPVRLAAQHLARR
ncbi:bifunctional sugar phosphate isomerase/epimerase/4-hydroxyphenylpyruvate dioxygenase family protein [Cellulomonas sp. Leaf334]|uniref:bifunctional sugar phosphate isomerase/epimerase/4-hydroxyphenylpyruvate dioxygenase family protein n=1 Tax=Cellulomonas sp. Leaf334 TaxID=1736339 RepID=UPI0006FC1819|nr:sugar phosphate isomerase/epimerase and 4-hydroxyphenylpyruvate domain-containing protein [Cellulomonas sp. Leaf334]KQR12445.1 4-hydroxyphenylpyruvate dioxygenase [Cellulomonas sp. Leaf334]